MPAFRSAARPCCSRASTTTSTVMKPLMQGLLKRRVKPYYLYQCDPIRGSGHFRTSVDKGLEIIDGLRGHTTGYACPQFVIDAPGGGGKILMAPDPVVGRDGDDLLLRNFEGNVYRYPDPDGTLGAQVLAPGGGVGRCASGSPTTCAATISPWAMARKKPPSSTATSPSRRSARRWRASASSPCASAISASSPSGWPPASAGTRCSTSARG